MPQCSSMRIYPIYGLVCVTGGDVLRISRSFCPVVVSFRLFGEFLCPRALLRRCRVCYFSQLIQVIITVLVGIWRSFFERPSFSPPPSPLSSSLTCGVTAVTVTIVRTYLHTPYMRRFHFFFVVWYRPPFFPDLTAVSDTGPFGICTLFVGCSFLMRHSF